MSTRIDTPEPDHTPRRGRLEALRASEQLLDRTLAALDQAVLVVNPITRTIGSANAAVERVFGYRPDEVVGRTTELLHVDHGRFVEFARLALAALDTQGVFRTEYQMRHKDGRVFATEHVVTEITDASGARTALVTAVRDISERKRAEQALRDSEAHFRGLADAMPQLVWTASSDGAVDYYNSRSQEYDGITRASHGGWDWQPIVHPDDLTATHAAWTTAVEAGTLYQCEHRVRMRDGTFRWHLSRAMPMRNADGHVVKWFGTATDIHELRESQQVLRENDRRKDEFLAMLAHELRNPLAPIKNAVQVLKRSSPPDLQLARMRDMIERQTEHVTRLVDDLLDVARITQGKIELRHEPVELLHVVGRAVETIRPLIDARRHQLTVSLPDAPVRLEGDLTRLAQVVANLMNNAAKYTEEGGDIRLQATQAGGELVLRVKDDGLGIPAADLPRVFDLFAQADRSLDRAHGGLGVGLTLVRQIVEMHGGRVQAFSDGPGRGSEFVVHLPTVTGPAPRVTDERAGARDHTAGGCCRILVVDDNADSAESLALLLELDGHEVTIAYDGPTALETTQRKQPHIVLLDIGLPGLNGFEVARRLRGDPDLAKTVLIALTGYGQEEDRARSQEAGFDHHLTKPVNHDVLATLIRSHILQ